jgi:uncharacterized protein with FMN-binding domain
MKKIVQSSIVLALMTALTLQSCASLDSSAPIDLSLIPDGTYAGEAQAFVVKARVEVKVAGGRIESFDILKHTCSPIGRPAEVLAGMVVEKQSLDLDAISGATLSSTAILVAGRNALGKANP